MDEYGWISVYRRILENAYLWDDKPFARGQAWIDLLLLANHKDKSIVVNGKEFVVRRGQKITSIRKLGERWGWSRTKVSDFLNSLQSMRMVKIESDTKKTLVTIENYGFYQDSEKQKGHQKDTEVTPKSTNNKGITEQCISNMSMSARESPLGYVMTHYMNTVSSMPSQIVIEGVKDYLEHMEPDVVIEAIDRALAESKRQWSYIKGILRNWRNSNVHNMADVARVDSERAAQKDPAGRKSHAGNGQKPVGRQSGPGEVRADSERAKRDMARRAAMLSDAGKGG